MSDELPEGWQTASLRDLLAEPLANGRSVPDGDGFPVLRLSALRDGRVDLSERKRGEWAFDDARRFLVRKDDFLVARGNGSLSLVGRGALVDGEPDHVAYPDTVIRVRPSANVLLSHYLCRVWASHAVRVQIEHAARTSAGIHKVSQQDLEGVELPLAPIAEQRRIVAKVEALLADVTKARERLDRVRLILNRFRQTVLAAACSGELTREWRETTQPIEGVWDEEDLPPSWTSSTVGDVASLVTDGDHNPPKRVGTGVPHLTAKHVKGGRLVTEGCTFISPEDYIRVKKRYEPKAGDLIVTCVGTLGQTAVVPEGMTFSPDRNLAAIRVRPAIDVEFLQIVLQAPATQRAMADASGSTAQPHLYLGDLRQLRVVVPSKDEQSAIVRRVRGLFALADAIERRIAAATARADKLPQAILAKAFSGGLVPTEAELARAEGRSYETAEELLARVRKDAEPAKEPSRTKSSGARKRRQPAKEEQ